MARKRPKVLITGIAGFGGHYLAEHLREQGCTVLGLDHPDALPAGRTVGTAAEVLSCDLTSLGADDLKDFLGRSTLAGVYHLAAIASVRLSWGSVQTTVGVNAGGTLNLMEALLRHRRLPPLLLVGSADQYGAVAASRQPLGESTPCRPRSPYALSKLWQEQLGHYYFGLHGWPVYMTRTFNHTGPRQRPNFVCADFARQVALIEAGRQAPVISVGNLRAVRDFLDVRDVVAAYRLILEKGRPAVPYNVASGRKVRIADILKTLLGMSRVAIEVRADPERMRPADIAQQWGDPRRLRRATGWRPVRDLGETLADLLEYWRRQVRGGGSE